MPVSPTVGGGAGGKRPREAVASSQACPSPACSFPRLHLWGPPSCHLPAQMPAALAACNLLLHGQEFGVHALLLPLHELHVGQQLGDTVLANLYVLILQSGYLGSQGERSLRCPPPPGHGTKAEGLVVCRAAFTVVADRGSGQGGPRRTSREGRAHQEKGLA